MYPFIIQLKSDVTLQMHVSRIKSGSQAAVVEGAENIPYEQTMILRLRRKVANLIKLFTTPRLDLLDLEPKAQEGVACR